MKRLQDEDDDDEEDAVPKKVVKMDKPTDVLTGVCIHTTDMCWGMVHFSKVDRGGPANISAHFQQDISTY